VDRTTARTESAGIRPGTGLTLELASCLLHAAEGSLRLRRQEVEALYALALAPGNFLSQDIAAPPGAVEITGDVPGEFLQTHARLYGSGHTFYWWIEGRGDAEAVVSVSPVRGFVVELGK